MSLAGKLADIADVAFPQMTKKQAEGVVSAISKISDDEAIREAVKALDQAQMDSLMKAIYKGLETMEGKSSSVLFKWHAVVTDIGGAGCIMRTLTDKVQEDSDSDDED